jgi:hypothetical protein
VENEVVVAPGDSDRVELDRAERAKDLQHRFGASRERPRGSEKVPRDEKATRRFGSDFHACDARLIVGA